MIVTEVFPLGKSRYRVSIDNSFAFVLYKGELSTYGITENKEISEEVYIEIIEQLLPKRAKKRAMNLLQKKNYTEYCLRKKLTEGYYPQNAIDEAIDYVKQYQYIDDARFAENYIFYYAASKSYKEMERFLLQKGIAKEIALKAYEGIAEEEQVPDEMEIGRKLLAKKNYDIASGDQNEWRKAFAFLVRKGISSEKAMKILKEEPCE